ncbi:MAG: UvrD-helicase domain-containing protein [Planctomycetia bacterium]|nr:UvrD-helicase domain-containing protein [Planctomycetia bacterium]
MSEGLNKAQQEAVSHHAGPLVVIAGPGSGKTRVMTQRIADMVHSGIAPGSILAITFTNKAAEEMLRRTMQLLSIPELDSFHGNGFFGSAALGLEEDRPVLRTFHSFCARLLRRHAHRLEPYTSQFSIYDSVDQKQLVTEVMKQLQLDRTAFPPRASMSTISQWKNQMVSPEIAIDQAATFRDRELGKLYGRYQELLEERDAADFDDLLLLVVRLLTEHPDVLERLQERFQYVMIDEFQDTNRPQYLIAKLLSQSHSNMCVTGDPDQAIYSWRGASPDNFNRFREDFPQHQVVTLEQNYRSTPQILEVASRLAGSEFGHRELFTENADGNAVRVQQLHDERTESRRVCDHVESWLSEGVSSDQIAVLYRVNSLSRAIEEEFVRRRLQYAVVGGMSFYERKEIKDILGYLRAARSSRDDVALQRIFNTPARGIGKVSLERFQDAAISNGRTMGEHLRRSDCTEGIKGKAKKGIDHLREVLEKLEDRLSGGLADLVEQAIEASGYISHLERSEPENWQEREQNLQELVAAAAETEEILDLARQQPLQRHEDNEDDFDPLTIFLERIALVADADSQEELKEKVSLMTLHAAKGLEFEKVIIIGVEETLIPHSRHGEVEGIDEEKRLLYVGVTRAMEELVLTHSSWRRRVQEREPRLPSSFLSELEGTSIEFDRSPSRSGHTSPTVWDEESAHDSEEDDGLHPGAWVQHELLGRGRVNTVQGYGSSRRITVRFENGEERQLVVAYAPLTPISPPDEEWEAC